MDLKEAKIHNDNATDLNSKRKLNELEDEKRKLETELQEIEKYQKKVQTYEKRITDLDNFIAKFNKG